MRLSETVKNKNYTILNFVNPSEIKRLNSLGFFVGTKLTVIDRKKNMLVVLVSNTMYAMNIEFANNLEVQCSI